MRNALMFSLLLTLGSGLAAQTPPPAGGRGAQPAQTKPQTPAPATRKPAQQATGRGGVAILITDPRGLTIPKVLVEMNGPAMRMGETNDSGQINFTMLPAGTYRVVFSGEHVTAFEREVTLKGSGVQQLDITLKPAPPPKEIIKEVPAAAAPAAPAAVVGPAGESRVLSLVDLAEKELERKTRRESLVACSGNTRATLLQLNQEQPERLYDSAESMFYVIAGEGYLRIGDKETRLEPGGFASVPRDTSFVLGRRGRNPFILLSLLSGEPCEEAK